MVNGLKKLFDDRKWEEILTLNKREHRGDYVTITAILVAEAMLRDKSLAEWVESNNVTMTLDACLYETVDIDVNTKEFRSKASINHDKIYSGSEVDMIDIDNYTFSNSIQHWIRTYFIDLDKRKKKLYTNEYDNKKHLSEIKKQFVNVTDMKGFTWLKTK